MKRILYVVRQTAYTIFSFCYFLGLAVEMRLSRSRRSSSATISHISI